MDYVMNYNSVPSEGLARMMMTPRRCLQKAAEPHELPGPPKNYGADINTLIELLESGRL